MDGAEDGAELRPPASPWAFDGKQKTQICRSREINVLLLSG